MAHLVGSLVRLHVARSGGCRSTCTAYNSTDVLLRFLLLLLHLLIGRGCQISERHHMPLIILARTE